VDVAERDQVPREEGEKAGEVRPRAGVGQREAMSSSPRAVSSSLVPGPGTVQRRREKRRRRHGLWMGCEERENPIWATKRLMPSMGCGMGYRLGQIFCVNSVWRDLFHVSVLLWVVGWRQPYNRKL
jgi:hypothetical protein